MSLRFYPDTNLKLPFLYHSFISIDELKKIDFTKHRENRAVLIHNAGGADIARRAWNG